MLHSCFSDSESDLDGEDGEEKMSGGYEQDASDANSINGNACEDEDAAALIAASLYPASLRSEESAVGGTCGDTCSESGGILARTALVARAQRVKVRSPGLKRSVEGVEV